MEEVYEMMQIVVDETPKVDHVMIMRCRSLVVGDWNAKAETEAIEMAFNSKIWIRNRRKM